MDKVKVFLEALVKPWKIKVADTYYPCRCNRCGWIGSSEDCGCDFGDAGDSDVYCPRCGSPDTDGYTDYYPILHFITDLRNRYRAWQMRKREDEFYSQYKPEEESHADR